MNEFVRRCVVSVRKLYLLRSIKAGHKPKWGDVFALAELAAAGYVTDDEKEQGPIRLTPAGEALLAQAEIEATDEA